MKSAITSRSAIDCMAALREAARLQHLARRERRLIQFYLEHNLTEAALDVRVHLLAHLRGARRQWQTALALMAESAR